MQKGFSKEGKKALDNPLSEIKSASPSASQKADVFQGEGSDCTDASRDDQCEELGQDLLAVEELKSRIDDHGNDDPVEESSEDRQSEKDDENRDGGSFDDGLRAISHVPPTGNQSHYDTESADLFLEVLGFGRTVSIQLPRKNKERDMRSY